MPADDAINSKDDNDDGLENDLVLLAIAGTINIIKFLQNSRFKRFIKVKCSLWDFNLLKSRN